MTAAAGLGVPGISSLIPHRETMLLVERVVRFVPAEQVVVRKSVSYTEPWYRGLGEVAERDLAYPLPLLLESWNQAAAILVMVTWRSTDTDVLTAGVPMLGSYTDLELGAPVLPGETMEHHVRIIRVSNTTMVLTGETRCERGVALRVGHGVVVRRSAEHMTAKRVTGEGPLVVSRSEPVPAS